MVVVVVVIGGTKDATDVDDWPRRVRRTANAKLLWYRETKRHGILSLVGR